MSLDRDKVRFLGKAIKTALELNASLDGEDSAPFVDALYAEFQSARPASPGIWLRDRLANAFVSMDSAPVWIEAEPEWPFLDGRPMTFISQTTISENETSNRLLSPGETVYLFGSRRPRGKGFEMIYRTVSQFCELRGVR